MSPTEVRKLTDYEIVDLLVALRPSDQAVAWLASVVADPTMVEGVNELRRRYSGGAGVVPTATPAGRHPHARTIQIDPDRWKSFFWRRRMTLSEVGPLMEPPRCRDWASVMATRGRAGLYALDDLACALSLHVDALILEVGSDDECARLASVCSPCAR